MRWTLIVLALGMGLLLGCPNDTDGDGDVDSDADGDGDADGDCTAEACHAPPFAVTTVSGTVVDGSGAPAADKAVAVCSAGRCFFGSADATGHFEVAVGGGDTEAVGIYFPNDGISSPFCEFTALCDGAVSLCHRFELHAAASSGTAVPEEPTTEELRLDFSGGAALIVPADAQILLPIGAPSWIALERFDLDDYVPCFLDPEDPPLALYAFTPMDTLIMDPDSLADPVLLPAGLDLPNDLGLAAGTVVDVAVVGGAHALDADLGEGELATWTTATVSADGTRIQTAAGEGIGYLTWLALFAR